MIKVGLGVLMALLPLLGTELRATELRDPTRPGRGGQLSLGQGEGRAANLVLGSIIRREGQAHAVINNRIVSVGERIQGVELVRIGEDRVVLADGRILTLFQASRVDRHGETDWEERLTEQEYDPHANTQRQGK